LEVFEHPGRYAHWFDGVNKSGGEQSAQLDKIFQENRRTAEIRMQQEALPGVRIDGTGNCRHFIAGHKFQLEQHETDEGQYVLTAVYHSGRQELGREPGREGEFSYENRFECIPLALPFRPQRVTAIPRIYGAQTAVVVGPKGEEIFTDKYGRVKVQFHWDRFGKNDPDSSCWMRVSQPWAGKGWGSVSVPRIGQEVIVDFLDGNPDRPIVTGKVYNAEQMPPYMLPAGAVVSGLKSNSTKGGGGYNEMSMNDTKSKEMVTIHAQKDMSTTVEHDDTQRIVTGNRKVDVEIGTHTETIKGDTTITIVTGNHKLDVQTGTHTHHVKAKVDENYDDTQKTVVAKDILIQSATAKITLDASTEIYLHCGSSFLSMKQDGSITLQGENVQILGGQTVKVGVGNQNVICDVQKVATSGAAINANAVGMHTISGAVVKIN
jgi:type VI secretion system secreted protein VgrG